MLVVLFNLICVFVIVIFIVDFCKLKNEVVMIDLEEFFFFIKFLY